MAMGIWDKMDGSDFVRFMDIYVNIGRIVVSGNLLKLHVSYYRIISDYIYIF